MDYSSGAMAAAFVMGMGQGYNADYCGTNPFEAVDSGSYWCGKAGMLVGGMISAGNPKTYIKAAGQALFKGATSAGVAMGEKAVTNMAATLTAEAVNKQRKLLIYCSLGCCFGFFGAWLF